MNDDIRARTKANMAKLGIPAGLGLPSEADRAVDEHFRSKPFEWCWPRITVYRPADTHPRLLLNRYPHNVIGAAIVAFRRCWGVQWKQSKGTRRRTTTRGTTSTSTNGTALTKRRGQSAAGIR